MRRREKGPKSSVKDMGSKTVQKEPKKTYKSRYEGELSPEGSIVEKYKNPSYPSRYK